MEQLKMYWLPDTPIREYPLPEGYSFSKYQDESDIQPWLECCKYGLVDEDASKKDFDESIENLADINKYEDVFFLDHNGEHIGTVTAFVKKAENIGDMHMVGIRPDYRGKGLAKYLSMIALQTFRARGVKYALLTTDEWRISAVKSYLSNGFLPVEYSEEPMQGRWEAVLATYGIPEVQMLNNDATPYKMIYAKDAQA